MNSLPEGLRSFRMLMVLGGMSPLFILWAIKGIPAVDDSVLWPICFLLVLIPNAILYFRIRRIRRNQMRLSAKLIVNKATDHREHLLVYLIAMLLPLFDANLTGERDLIAVLIALLVIFLLFWYMNLHYMNLFFLFQGYKVFTIDVVVTVAVHPAIQQEERKYVLLSRRTSIPERIKINADRLSDTVYIEVE